MSGEMSSSVRFDARPTKALESLQGQQVSIYEKLSSKSMGCPGLAYLFEAAKNLHDRASITARTRTL